MNSINALKANKAVDHDNILLFFLRIAAHIISPFLKHFIHFSFTKGIFLESCTPSKVIPIHKKGNKLELNNYQPISILTCFSKILEKLIHNKVLEFFKKHNVVHKTHCDFQKNVSTTHAVLDLVTTSLNNINKNVFTGLIFLDLQKAFDIVSHNILLHKLNHYGIRGPACSQLQSFLRRKQFVGINNVNSKIESNNHGVAQGSTLGPILFLLYINDLHYSTNILPRLFADDTCLIINSRNEKLLEIEINKNLLNVMLC